MCNKRNSPAGRRYAMRKNLFAHAEICLRNSACGISDLIGSLFVMCGILIGIPVFALTAFGIF